jgi:hypothetical protein
MPRYYFHVHDHEVTCDEAGLDLPGLDEAREVALEGARERVCQCVHRGELNLDDRIEVVGEQGEPLITLSFREAFAIPN